MRKNKSASGGAGRAEVCAVPCFNLHLVRKLRAALPDDALLEESRVLFAALADRARLKILFSLRGGEEICVCDVAHILGSSVATASHHLRKLRDLGFLKFRNDGRMAYYSLRLPLSAELVTHAAEALSQGHGHRDATSRVRAAGRGAR